MALVSGLLARTALVSAAALTLVACDSSGSYRVASVGSTPPGGGSTADGGSGSGGGTSTDGTGGSGGGSGSGSTAGGGSGSGSGSGQTGQGLLVTAGNAVMGSASTLNGAAAPVNSAIPASGVVTGTVDRVLNRTGQTLVRLGNGSSVLLDGTGGRVGEVVSLDLGEGKVVGGSSPLVGLNVLARNPSTGSLASVGAASGGNLVSVTVPQSALNNGAVGNTVAGVGNVVNGATGGAITAGVTGNAGVGNTTAATAANGVVNGVSGTGIGATVNTVNAVTQPLNATVAGAPGSGLGATVNAVTQPATATVNAALTPK